MDAVIQEIEDRIMAYESDGKDAEARALIDLLIWVSSTNRRAQGFKEQTFYV